MRSISRIVTTLILVFIVVAAGGAVWAAPPMGPVYITASQPGDQFTPAVVWDHEHERWLAVWEQDVSGVRAIVGRLVNSDGYPIGYSFFISDDPAKDATAPDVVYDPVHDRYLVVWEHHYSATDWDIYGRFVTWDGLDPALIPFPVEEPTTFQGEPAIEYNPFLDEYLVVWSDREDFLSTATIKAKRLYADTGYPVGPSVELVGDATYERRKPRLAWNAVTSMHLVVYERFHGTDQEDVYAQAVLNSLITIGPEFGIAGFPDEENQIDVAACEGSWMVVWKGGQDPDGEIYARAVAGDLTLGSITNAGAPYKNYRRPAVSCIPHGVGFFTVWEGTYTNGQEGIFGAFLTSDGTTEEQFRVMVQTVVETRDFTRPAVSVGNWKNRAFVVWETDRADLVHHDLAGRWVEMVLFADDFETGNTTRWSSTTP